jgi:hypothetical protein
MKTLLILVVMLFGAGCAGKKQVGEKPCKDCHDFKLQSTKGK